MDRIAPHVPRVDQTLPLDESTIDSLRPWATDGTGVSAAARVRDSQGRIALIRNEWTEGWFLPGGAVERGEDPAQAASREVREETGLRASIGDPIVVLDQSYVVDGGDSVQFTAAFVVFDATANGEIPDPDRLGVGDEAIEGARWFDQLPEHLHDGEYLRGYL